jgi:hypothetical protein
LQLLTTTCNYGTTSTTTVLPLQLRHYQNKIFLLPHKKIYSFPLRVLAPTSSCVLSSAFCHICLHPILTSDRGCTCLYFRSVARQHNTEFPTQQP